MERGRSVRIRVQNEEKMDLISTLSDHLLHLIIPRIPIKQAVWTNVLSRRWYRLWTTLPYLNFDATHFCRFSSFCKFVNNFLSKRNQRSDTCVVRLFLDGLFVDVDHNTIPNCYVILMRVAEYAISHNVQELSIKDASIGQNDVVSNSVFSSKSLKKFVIVFTLKKFEWDDSVLWNLPALTSLHLVFCSSPPLPPVLRALTTLELDNVTFQGDYVLSFEGFVNLKNLTLRALKMWGDMEVFSIKSVGVVNLTIAKYCDFETCGFEFSVPNLKCFHYTGYYPLLLSAEDGLPCLEEVYIHIHEGRKVTVKQVISMFGEIRGAKFLTLSYATMKVLCGLNFSDHQPSPFANLTFLKLGMGPYQYFQPKNSCDEVINHFLSSSPAATVLIQVKEGVFQKYKQNANVLQDLNKPGSLKCIKQDEKATCVSDEVVCPGKEANKERAMVQNTLVEREENLGRKDLAHNEKMLEVAKTISGQVNVFINPTKSPVGVNDQVNSHRMSDKFSLWEGHYVNPEYVDLLKTIKEKYPETFERFGPKTEMMYTLGLNTLGSLVTAYSKVYTTKVTSSIIMNYKDLFADLESWGFNTAWLVKCLENCDEICSIDHKIDDAQKKEAELRGRLDDALKCVKELQLRIDDAQKEVKQLQATRLAKMAEIQEDVGYLGSAPATSCLGD